MIFFETITPQNSKNVHRIFPGDTGKYWVNFSWYWLELSNRRPGIQAKFVSVSKGADPLGFLAYGQHYKDRLLTEAISGAFEMYHVVIDSFYQGQGLGKLATVLSLKEMAQNQNCEQVLVACHPDNKSATQLYKNLGFCEVGKNYDEDPLYAITKEQIIELRTPAFVLKSPTIVARTNAWELESQSIEAEFSWTDWEQGLES
jgi:ribosomal protein S18 acetylase RimI-like enzyme